MNGAAQRQLSSRLPREAERTLQPLLAGLAARGERPAIIQMTRGDAQTTSYGELASRIACFAAGARRAHLDRGEAVGLFADGGADWVVACLGLIGAGAVPVPLDVQLDTATLEHVLASCKARWILTDERRLEALRSAGYKGKWLRLDAPAGDSHSWYKWMAERPADFEIPDPDDRALLFYTSGTTGPPKGVPLKHRHLAFQLETVAAAHLVGDHDRVLQPLPLHHVYPLVVGMLAPLALGLPVITPQAMTGPELVRAMRDGEVTFVIGVPRLYGALYDGIRARIEQAPGPVRPLLKSALALSVWLRRRAGVRAGKLLLYPLHRRLAPRLRVLASGGSALDPELGWSLEGMGWRVAIGYGLTETAPLLTLNPPGTPVLESVGRAVPGIELRIDPAAHAGTSRRPPGTEGEILARGASVFDGYLGREGSAGDDVFTADGWYRTGDLGWIDESGYLFVTGRVKTLIVTGAGKNIQPEEVEDAYAAHRFVEEIGVYGSDEGLRAVIVPAAQEIRAAGDLAEGSAVRQGVKEVSETLASYKRISHYVVSHEPLERTRLGKIQRHLLEQRYERLLHGDDVGKRPAPISVEEMSAEDRRLLREKTARKVWDLLASRYADRRLAPDASLQLDLGVDSLGWLDLSTEIAERAGVVLDESRIAKIDTVRDLLQEMSRQPDTQQELKAPLQDPEAVLGERQLRWLEPLSAPARVTARTLYAVNRLLMKGMFRVHALGTEHLQHDAQLVIAPNHTSYLDPFVVAAALPPSLLRRTFWGGWTGIAFRNALFRGASRLARAVPIDPDRAVISSLAFAAAILRRGDHLVWFPEGERSVDGELGEFRPGLGVLLAEFGDVAVVPTSITGAYEAWPRHKRLPRPHAITIRFGRPLQASELARGGQGEEPRRRITSGLHSSLLSLREKPAAS